MEIAEIQAQLDKITTEQLTFDRNCTGEQNDREIMKRLIKNLSRDIQIVERCENENIGTKLPESAKRSILIEKAKLQNEGEKFSTKREFNDGIMTVVATVIEDRNVNIRLQWKGSYWGKKVHYKFESESNVHELVVNGLIEKHLTYSKFRKYIRTTKKGTKLLILNFWMTEAEPGSERHAFMNVDALWKSLAEIQKIKKKIIDDQKTPQKRAFYNNGNRNVGVEPKKYEKAKPLFAAAEDSETDSETGEIFIRGSFTNDDW